MTIKSVSRANQNAPAQVQISDVTNGGAFNHQTLTQVLAQVASAPAGVEYTVEVTPIAPLVP